MTNGKWKDDCIKIIKSIYSAGEDLPYPQKRDNRFKDLPYPPKKGATSITLLASKEGYWLEYDSREIKYSDADAIYGALISFEELNSEEDPHWSLYMNLQHLQP